MKRKIGYSFLLFFATISSVFAAPNAPEDLRVLELSDTSFHIDWQDSQDVIGYYMYYGTQSGSGGSYEIEGIDLIEESEYTLEGLSPETIYYIAVTSIDSFGSESEYSKELEYQTLPLGSEIESTNFRIKDVIVIDETTLEFVFSSNLDTSLDATMDFIIEEKISGNEVSIDVSQVDTTDSKNAIVLLSNPLQTALEYKVTVLDIKDASGNTIESGIDGFISFVMPVISQEESEEDITSEDEIPVKEGEETGDDALENNGEEENIEDTDLLSAGPEEYSGEMQEVSGDNAGTTLSDSELSDNMSLAAQENDTLPQTGPEHILLLFVTIILTGGIFMLRSKKHSL